MREMLGKSGASMVVVPLYLPTRSGAKEPGGGAWDWQVQQMVNLRARLQRTRERAELNKRVFARVGPKLSGSCLEAV